MEPVYLQDMLVPEERIAEMAKFREFAKNDTPEDLVIKTAWHETAHAIGWVLSGGALERATIIPPAVKASGFTPEQDAHRVSLDAMWLRHLIWALLRGRGN